MPQNRTLRTRVWIDSPVEHSLQTGTGLCRNRRNRVGVERPVSPIPCRPSRLKDGSSHRPETARLDLLFFSLVLSVLSLVEARARPPLD